MKKILSLLALTALTIGLLGSCKKEDPKVSETKTMAEILKTATGIPESQNLTPPANAWVNSTDSDCKAFIGVDADGDKLFVIKKEGLSNPPAVCMDDEFEKIDDNTYKRTEPDFTFTVKMTEGKFTSLEFNTNIERIIFLNGTYSAPVSSPTFKAVYNTNGGANTLTFYFDANDHSGEGITVYEDGTDKFLFDDTKKDGAKWGYDGKRGEIKSVVIDASVAGYKGLTSTAYMFEGMNKASSISGAEHLNVSNVTDMSWMFQKFGGGSSGEPTTLNSVPNVSGWNTGKVTDMSLMFAYYGHNSELDKVPDVSEWNTGNVTNMTGVFAFYGYNSSMLNKVPDVSGWNTGNVTDMHQMFKNYGHESQTFNAVPDVSKWNTDNVTNMANIFYEYGHKSTVLNTVPDVSGWNTGNVTNMQQMFYEYGNASTNISCVLDLSGWDLSKITGANGGEVFKFNPKTFKVTIPAKTGEKSNEGGKWYYGDGTNSIAPPTGKTFTPASTISTIADVLATAGDNAPSAANHWNDTKGNYIYVDGGNLLVHISAVGGDASVNLDSTVTPNGDNYLYSEGVLSFTFNMTEGVLTSIYVNCSMYGVNDTFSPAGTLEYVEIGGLKWATKNLGAEKVTDSGDYFAWGETAPYYEGTGGWPATPTWKSGKESGYAWESYCGSSSFSEWSTPPYDATTKILKTDFDAAAQILGNGWRMPTSAEFQALNDACGGTVTPKTGGSTSTTEKGVYWCTNYDGVAGLLFCDGTNKLFFPAAGYVTSTDPKSVGTGGCYWLSSLNADYNITHAYFFNFNQSYMEPHYLPSSPRYWGFSVRPVK